MKKLGFLIVSLFVFNTTFGQNGTGSVAFGKQFIDTIALPSRYNYIKSIKMYPICKKDSKKYYNDPSYNYKVDSLSVKDIFVVERKDSLNLILIPPLKPNRFYELVIEYVGKNNIYGDFREMHHEKFSLYDNEYNWVNILKKIHQETKPFSYYYHPTNKDLKSLKEKLTGFVFKKGIDTTKLEKLVYNELKTLNFNKNNITRTNIIDFCKWLKNFNDFDAETGTEIFKYFGKIPDYLRIYDFYSRYLEDELENNPIKYYIQSNFEELVSESIIKEEILLKGDLEENEPNPNYLEFIKKAVEYSKSITNSTYTEKYETSYKRALVPDFGYIVYIPYEGGIKGGAPYVGVHISLSPTNKDVPLKLSELSFSQRFSIHTGVTLNSLKKEGYSDDFFSNYSLLLGGGYKILTQSTRLNFGGVLFKKIDAVSGNESIAIQPYIGLSIDIEIKNWLESIIPSFTNNFKTN